jgi:hypothetical protein
MAAACRSPSAVRVAIRSSAALSDPVSVATRLSSRSARVASNPSASDRSLSCAFSAFNSSSWLVISSRSTYCTTMKIVSTKIITIRSEVIASTKPGQIEPVNRFPARR